MQPDGDNAEAVLTGSQDPVVSAMHLPGVVLPLTTSCPALDLLGSCCKALSVWCMTRVLWSSQMAPGRKTLLRSSRKTRWTPCWPWTPTTLRRTTRWWEAAEAAAVEVESVDFPEEYADGKDELTLRDAVAEEVLRGRDECLPRGANTAPILRCWFPVGSKAVAVEVESLTLRDAVAEEVLRGRDECLPRGRTQPLFFDFGSQWGARLWLWRLSN